MERVEGWLVHAWTDYASGRLLLAGRALDGRSFAAVDDRFRPALYLPSDALGRVLELAAGAGFEARGEASALALPDGRPCAVIRTPDRGRRPWLPG